MNSFEATTTATGVGMVVEETGARNRAIQSLGAAHMPYSSSEITFHRGLGARHQSTRYARIFHATLYNTVRRPYDSVHF